MACSVCGELTPCENECPETVKIVNTVNRRMKVFQAEGMSEADAFELAGLMLDRDLDAYDDRRVCFECSRYDNNKKVCAVTRKMPMRFTLQRCDHFDMRGQK